ncbi:hypothetical protein V8C40DRAFT_237367 [Trichoderma camerunense]
MMPAQRLCCVTCATSTPTPTSTINNILVRFNTTENTPQHHSPQIRSEYHLTNNNSSFTKRQKMTPRYAHPRRLPAAAAHCKRQD